MTNTNLISYGLGLITGVVTLSIFIIPSSGQLVSGYETNVAGPRGFVLHNRDYIKEVPYVFLENGEIITLDQLHENQMEQLNLTNKIGLTELLEKQEIERQSIKPLNQE